MGNFLQNEAHEAEQGGGQTAGAYPAPQKTPPKWQPYAFPPDSLRQGATTYNPWDTSTSRFAWMGQPSTQHF